METRLSLKVSSIFACMRNALADKYCTNFVCVNAKTTMHVNALRL